MPRNKTQRQSDAERDAFEERNSIGWGLRRPRVDTEEDRLWVAILCFLVALAVAGLLSIDDVDGPMPTAPEFVR